MIYTALSGVALVLAMALSGYELFGSSSWWAGVATGATLGIAWVTRVRLGRVLGLLGMGLLAVGATGALEGMHVPDRALFNGMAIGSIVGVCIGAAWRWSEFKPTLVGLARAERVRWLSKLLGGTLPE